MGILVQIKLPFAAFSLAVIERKLLHENLPIFFHQRDVLESAKKQKSQLETVDGSYANRGRGLQIIRTVIKTDMKISE